MIQNPQMFVERGAINQLYHGNSLSETERLIDETGGNGLRFTFEAPRTGIVRGIVFAIGTFNIPISNVEINVEVSSDNGASYGIPNPGWSIPFNTQVKDPVFHSDGEANPYILFDRNHYFKLDMGKKVRITFKPLATCDFTMMVVNTNCASFPYTESLVGSTPTSEPGETPVIAIDYNTGSLDDFSQLSVPLGCMGGRMTDISDAHTAIEGVATEFLVGTQSRITGSFAYGFIPATKEFELQQSSVPDRTVYAESFNMSFFSAENKPIMIFDRPNFYYGNLGTGNKSILVNIRFVEQGTTVIEDLETAFVRSAVDALNKSTLPFAEITKGSIRLESSSLFIGQFGSFHTMGVFASEHRDITEDEARLLGEFLGLNDPNNPNADFIVELGERSGFSAMAITPADISLAQQLAETQGDELT